MYPLKLTDDFRYYSTLIWQVPSWAIAIGAGVIVAADRIGKLDASMGLPVNYVQALILFFGSSLLIALTIGLYKYRIMQAACTPYSVAKPPFGLKPPANLFLQGALCMTTGGLVGLAATHLFSITWLIIVGLIIGAFCWIIAELGNKCVVGKIDKDRKAAAENTLKNHG
jgi:hypothetical protein